MTKKFVSMEPGCIFVYQNETIMTLSYKVAAFAKQLNMCISVHDTDACYNKALKIGIPQWLAFGLRATRANELRIKYIASAKK